MEVKGGGWGKGKGGLGRSNRQMHMVVDCTGLANKHWHVMNSWERMWGGKEGRASLPRLNRLMVEFCSGTIIGTPSRCVGWERGRE